MSTATAAGIRDSNTVLADITSAMVGEFQISVLLKRVVETSMKTLGAEVCSIFLEDPEQEPGVLTMMAGSGFAERLIGKAKYRIGEAFTGMIAKKGQKFNIRSRRELEELAVDGQPVWRGKFDSEQWPTGQSECRNLIALPLKIKDHTLGVIKVENKRETYGPYFTEEDEKYFETIANVVALVIENARLHQKAEQQLKTIAAKAAHRIGNLATDYDGVELDLKDQVDSPVCSKAKLAEILDRTRLTTRNLKTLVHDIKTFGKPLVIRPVPSDLNKVIADEVWHAHPPAQIEVQQDCDRTIPQIALDPRFAEAIKELLRNSIKAIEKERGTICISTRLIDESGPRRIVMEVKDSGPGFPPDLPIFEPFVATDPESTGLGLATVKELVEGHGGTIIARNNPFGGACVEVTLPVNLQGN